jgi:hypothetical protein
MSLYKNLIDLTVPCQVGSCNVNLIRDTIKSYVTKSYEMMKQPITSIVGDWYDKIYELLTSILAYSQSCDNVQFTMQDFYTEIFDLATQICETLHKCDGPKVDKFLQESKETVSSYAGCPKCLTCSVQPSTSSKWLVTSGKLEAPSAPPTVP